MGAVLRRAGHSVVPVASAGEALAELDLRLRSGALPDVALVDVGLPDMSGFELCRRLKAQPPTAALPVVHFSAAAVAPGDRCRGLDAGGEAYLTVPAEPEEIQAVVRAAVRGARMRNGAEALVRRLTLLSETIVDVQAARTLEELAGAAAEGAARLTRSPAAVFVLGEDGHLCSGTSRARARTTLPDSRRARDRGPAHPPRHRRRPRAARHRRPRAPVARGLLPARRRRGRPAGPGPHRERHTRLRRHTRAGHPRHGIRRHGPGRPSRPGHRPGSAALLMYQVERHVALTLQHSFLPKRVPEFPGLEVVVRYVPASRRTEIGGDFYAALSTGDGVLTAVGDVVGHSLEAATVMVEIRHALRAYCVEQSDPVALARRLDRMLQHYHPDVTATVCLALVEPGSGRVRIANAGHIPPLIVRDSGEAEYVKAAGPLLGLGLDRPEPTETVLWPTDRLLMVTDGLVETRGIDLSLSLEQLRAAAAGAPAGTVALCDTLLHCFGRDREDDIAMLALRLRLG